MKITVQNLRGIAGPTSIDVDRNIFLTGDNGAGKSTLALAPYYVLTGKGLSDKKDAPESMATIELDGMKISRHRRNGKMQVYLNDKPVSGTLMREEFSLRGVNPEVAAVLFEEETRLNSSSLLKIAGLKMTPESISALMFPDASQSNEKRVVLEHLNMLGVSEFDIPLIKKAASNFVDFRRTSKRKMKDAKALLANITVNEDDDFSALLSEISEKTAKLLAQKELLRKEEANAKENESKRIRLTQALDQKKALVKTHAEKIAGKKALEKAIKDGEKKCVRLNEQIKTVDGELQAKEAASIKAKEAVCETIIAINKVRTVIANQTKTVSKLQNTTQCPIYEGMPCTADKSSAISALNEEIAKAKQELETLEARRKEQEAAEHTLQEEINTLKEHLSQLQKDEVQARMDVANARSAVSNIDEFASLQKTLEADVASLTAEIAGLPNTNVSHSDQIQQLDTSIEELKRQSESVAADIRAQEQKKKLLNELKAEQEQCDCYDHIAKALENLPNLIFRKIIDPLQSASDAVLSVLKPEWKVKFVSEKDVVRSYLHTPNGIIEAEELSSGEKIIFNYLMKAIVCQLTGLDTIILDNIDLVDSAHIKALGEVVKNSSFKTLLLSPNNMPAELHKVFLPIKV